MRDYRVRGPYPVTVTRHTVRNGKPGRPKIALKYAVNENNAPEYHELKSQYGCYIFATKWSDNYKPWYVGKTIKTFDKEIFTPHKLGKLDELREIQHRGQLYVFLIVPVWGRGARNSSATDNMETFLIGACHKANPDLLNLRKLPKNAWVIVGVTTKKKGKPTSGEQAMQSFVGA